MTRSSLFYSPDGQPIEWEEYAGIIDAARRVALDNIRIDGHLLIVSTVYLGIDHGDGPPGPPLIFETMTFDETDTDIATLRYATREQALKTHAQTVDGLVEAGGERLPDPREPFEDRP